MVLLREDDNEEFPICQLLSSCDLCSSLNLSKTLKSGHIGPCTLLLLAEGLPKLSWSRFIGPSCLFIGLIATIDPANPPPRLFSARVNGFGIRFSESSRLIFSLSSALFRRGQKSSRSASVEVRFLSGIGDALPESVRSDSTRLDGLFGEVLIRVKLVVWGVLLKGGRCALML